MKWPIRKIYEYMAFMLTESEEFKKNNKPVEVMDFDQISHAMGFEEDGG